MLEHFIRRVSSIIVPENIGCTSCTTKPTFSFRVPPEFGVSIEVGEGLINSEVNVDIAEISINKAVFLTVNARPYNTFRDLTHAEISVDKEIREIRGHKVLSIDHADPPFHEYAIEKPSRLSIVEGEKYRFIIGENTKYVFVDGWLKQALSPSWRVTIPTAGKTHHTQVVVPSARLLIFE